MIETIEIMIQNGPIQSLYALIVYPRNICYKDNKKYIVTDDFLKEITRTIRLWKNEYGTSNIIDDEEFKVIVKTKEKEETFHGKGIFPNNYEHLKEVLGDLYD